MDEVCELFILICSHIKTLLDKELVREVRIKSLPKTAFPSG